MSRRYQIEQIERMETGGRKAWRQFNKRQTRRAMRRVSKKLMEDAPKKNRYYGWSL